MGNKLNVEQYDNNNNPQMNGMQTAATLPLGNKINNDNNRAQAIIDQFNGIGANTIINEMNDEIQKNNDKYNNELINSEIKEEKKKEIKSKEKITNKEISALISEDNKKENNEDDILENSIEKKESQKIKELSDEQREIIRSFPSMFEYEGMCVDDKLMLAQYKKNDKFYFIVEDELYDREGNILDKSKIIGIRRVLNRNEFKALIEFMEQVSRFSIEDNFNLEIIMGECALVSGDKNTIVAISNNNAFPTYCNFRFSNINKLLQKLKYFANEESITIDEYPNIYKCRIGNITLKVKNNKLSKKKERVVNEDGTVTEIGERVETRAVKFTYVKREELPNSDKLVSYTFDNKFASKLKDMVSIENTNIRFRKDPNNNKIIMEKGNEDTGIFIITPDEDATIKNLDNISKYDIDTNFQPEWFKYDYNEMNIHIYHGYFNENEICAVFINGTINEEYKFPLYLYGKSFMKSYFNIFE